MNGLSMKDLGNQIREKRKEKGMSQEKLASILGITKSTISKYELGLREPSFEQLMKIADALSIGPFSLIPEAMQDAFFTGYNHLLHTYRYENAKTDEEADAAEDDAFDLFQYFNELNEFGQKRAIACVRALAGFEPIIDESTPHPIECIVTAVVKLNDEGQKKAVEFVELLTDNPKLRKTQQE